MECPQLSFLTTDGFRSVLYSTFSALCIKVMIIRAKVWAYSSICGVLQRSSIAIAFSWHVSFLYLTSSVSAVFGADALLGAQFWDPGICGWLSGGWILTRTTESGRDVGHVVVRVQRSSDLNSTRGGVRQGQGKTAQYISMSG